MGFPRGSMVKNPPASAGDAGSVPGSGRSSGVGNGNPPQCSCLGKPMDKGAWWAMTYQLNSNNIVRHMVCFQLVTIVMMWRKSLNINIDICIRFFLKEY